MQNDGKLILHKSLFNQKKEPYAKYNDIRLDITSPEGGVSSISHTADTVPAISLESRGDANGINKISTNKSKDKDSDNQEDSEQILGLDRKVVQKKADNAVKRVSLNDFMAKKDGYRPQMEGVYHEDGYEVASDSYSLVTIKTDYPANLEDQIVDKKGDIIEVKTKEGARKYPNWQAIIPEYKESDVLEDSIEDILNAATLAVELNKSLDDDSIYVRLSNGNIYNASQLQRCAAMAKKLGYGIITCIGKKSPVLFRKDTTGKEIIISMPRTGNCCGCQQFKVISREHK